jgi:hypothetical protein
MLWKGVVALACTVAGIEVISVALGVVGMLKAITTIIGADDRQTEAKNALKDWALEEIADRIVTAAASAIIR